MTITSEEKQQIIGEFAGNQGDSGSPGIQVAILSKRIGNLTEHFRSHPKDNHSRRGLLQMVSKRRRLLDYVKSKSETNYFELIKRLGLRR